MKLHNLLRILSISVVILCSNLYSRAEITITNDNGVTCYGQTRIYTVESGHTNYSWQISGSAGTDYTYTAVGNQLTVKWLKPGNYTINVHYDNPVTHYIKKVVVTTESYPIVTIRPSVSTTCQGEAINFTFTRVDSNYILGQTWTVIGNAAGSIIYLSSSDSTSHVSIPIYSAGNTTYELQRSFTAGNCVNDDKINGPLTIISTPTITNYLADQNVCFGSTTTPINFAGSFTSTEWQVISNPGNITGFPAGSDVTPQAGNFGSYTLENSSTTPQTALIRVVPKATQNGVTCTGAASTFRITVNPKVEPITNLPVTTIEACNLSQLAGINYSSPNATSYLWHISSNPGNISGIPTGNLQGYFGGYNVSNPTTTTQTVIIAATPVYNNCPGDSQTFSINVHPRINVNSNFPDYAICSGDTTHSINLSGSSNNYTWEVINLPSGLTGLPSGPQTNNFNGRVVTSSSTKDALTATIKITPSSDNICFGDYRTFNLRVEAAPTIELITADLDTQNVCLFSPITTTQYVIGGSAWGINVTGLIPTLISDFKNDTVTIHGAPRTIQDISYFIYTVGQSSTCKPAVGTGLIRASPLPTIEVANITVCEHNTDPIDLTDAIANPTAGASGYFYTDPAGKNQIGTPISIPNLDTAKTYYAKTVYDQTSTLCSSVLKPFNILKQSAPDLSVQDIEICAGTNADLTKAVTSTTSGNILTFYADSNGINLINDSTNVAGIVGDSTIYAAIRNSTTLCRSELKPFTVKVKTPSSISIVGNEPQRLCANSSISDIEYTLGGGADTLFIQNSLPSGITFNYNSNDKKGILSGTPTNAGTYTVFLSTRVDEYCITATATATFFIFPKPKAAFIYNKNAVNGLEINFTDQSILSKGTIKSWGWDFGDGNTSTSQNTSNTYLSAQNYDVKLTVTSDSGCVDSVTQLVHPDINITVDFSINDDKQCFVGNNFEFTNLSELPGAADTTYLWDFGDGTTSSEKDPTHSYAQAGLYIVTLKDSVLGVPSVLGSKPVAVYPTPIIITQDINICKDENANLNLAIVSSNADSIAFYSDPIGNTPISDPSNITISTTTKFYVRGIDTIGSCAGSMDTIEVVVNALPTINISGANFFCYGDTVDITKNVTLSSGSNGAYFQDPVGNKPILNPTKIAGLTSLATFYVKAVNQSTGCESSLAALTVLPNPRPGIAVKNIEICEDLLNGTVVNLRDAVDTISVGSTPYFFSSISATSSIHDSTTVSVDSTGTYFARAVSNGTSCTSDVQSFNVIVHPTPNIGQMGIRGIDICEGDSLDLTRAIINPDSTSLFLYYQDSLKTYPIANPRIVSGATVNRRYYVEAANTYCESILAHINISVSPMPTFTMNSASICSGDSINIDTLIKNISQSNTYPNFYEDAFGAMSVDSIVSPEVSKTYYARLTSTVGCVSTIQPTDITVNPTPIFRVGTPPTICAGDSVNLQSLINSESANSTIRYFSDASAITPIPSPIVRLSNNSTFYIKSTDNTSRCQSTIQPIAILVNQLPTFTVTQPAAICAGVGVSLPLTVSNISANSTVSFYNDTLSNMVINPTTVTPSSSRSYYAASADSVTGCKSIRQQIAVSVNQLPTFTVTEPAPICAGQTVVLSNYVSNISTNSTVKYYANATATIELASSTVNPTRDTVFYVRSVSNANCQSRIQLIRIKVNTKPTVIISGPQNVCKNSIISLVGTPVNGTWKSLDRAKATVDIQGVVKAIGAGSVQIRYTVTNELGCTDSSTYNITVNALPTIATITGNNNICAGTYTQLSSTTASGVWSVADTTIARVSSTGYVRGLTEGSTNVRYSVTNAQGCTDSAIYTLKIKPRPKSKYTYAPNVSTPILINFIDQSTMSAGSSITSWYWNFGDGNESTEQNPSNTFAVSQNYYVVHIVNASNGCSDTIFKRVNPAALLEASFTIDTNKKCISGNVFSFTNTSRVIGATSTSYSWDFGDGTTSTIESPTHSYTQAGTYNIRQIVTIAPGPLSDTVIQSVTVLPLPSVSISNNTNICLGTSNTLVGTPTNGTWKSITPTTASVNIAGVVSGVGTGSATIRYIVSSTEGCTDSADVSLIVNGLPAQPGVISGINSVCVGNTRSLTSTPANGIWTSSSPTVVTIDSTTGVVTGNIAGNANIFYTVANGNGCKNSSTTVYTVNPKPSVTFTYSPDPISPILIQFTNQSTVSAGTLTTQGWKFGDGASSTDQNPLHEYNASSYFNVTLTEVTGEGCIDSAIRVMHTDALVDAKFTVDNQVKCLTNNNFIFTNTSRVLGATDTSYFWSFGDGTSSTSANVAHNYTNPGTYEVMLVTSIMSGTLTDTTRQTITVSPLPTVTIVGAQNTCEGLSLQLSNSTTGGIWTSLNPSIATVNSSGLLTAVSSGTVTLEFAATSAAGCMDSALVSITIDPAPNVNFNASPTSVCENGTVTFTVNRTDSDPATDWYYIYNDEVTNTTVNVNSSSSTFTMSFIDTTTISMLNITNNLSGCSSNDLPLPIIITVSSLDTVPAIISNGTVFCEGESLSLTSNITDSNYHIQWYLNEEIIDGATSPNYNVPELNLSDSGIYYVKVLSGCDTHSMPIRVEVRSDQLLVKKWNDVILVDNSSFMFKAYQWYRNGQLLDGATDQSYLEIGGLDGTYSAEITLIDDSKIITCERTYTKESPVRGLIIYPNPLPKGQSANILLNKEIIRYNEGTIKADIFDSNGILVLSRTYLNGELVLETSNLSTGIYILQITTEKGSVYSEKFVVM